MRVTDLGWSPRVFVSHSTMPEVEGGADSYVRAAIAAVHDLDFVAVEMTDFLPRDRNPADVCKEQVLTCDILVLICGARYGDLVPGKKISYTEMEYRTAVADKMPVLAFFVRDMDRGSGAYDRNEFKLQARERFHADVKTGRHVTEIGSPWELRSKLGRSIPYLMSDLRLRDEARRRQRRLALGGLLALIATVVLIVGVVMSTGSEPAASARAQPVASEPDEGQGSGTSLSSPPPSVSDPTAALAQRVQQDRPRAEAVHDRWIVQLSTLSGVFEVPGGRGEKQTAAFMLAETQRLSSAYPDVIVVNPRTYTSYELDSTTPSRWVVLYSEVFNDPNDAVRWCEQNDREVPDDCFAKQLSHQRGERETTYPPQS